MISVSAEWTVIGFGFILDLHRDCLFVNIGPFIIFANWHSCPDCRGENE